MHANELILYVDNQQRSRDFYQAVFEVEPTLDVPGMTEFDLGGVTLGVMPARDIAQLIPGLQVGAGQRCELYLRRPDADALMIRILRAGGHMLAAIEPRPWGESVGYALDPDGHVIACASE